jgi:hypothetical protein
MILKVNSMSFFATEMAGLRVRVNFAVKAFYAQLSRKLRTSSDFFRHSFFWCEGIAIGKQEYPSSRYQALVVDVIYPQC